MDLAARMNNAELQIEQLKEKHHDLRQELRELKLRLFFWSGFGAAAGNILGIAGHAAASNLLGG